MKTFTCFLFMDSIPKGEDICTKRIRKGWEDLWKDIELSPKNVQRNWAEFIIAQCNLIVSQEEDSEEIIEDTNESKKEQDTKEFHMRKRKEVSGQDLNEHKGASSLEQDEYSEVTSRSKIKSLLSAWLPTET